jgi:dihydrolipoamide dehydrogenase
MILFMPSEHADVVVIGGGPGGYAAAFRAADLGKQVTIVDPEPLLGGSCLIRGCIPSKALITAAELTEQIRGAEAIGIQAGPVIVHMDRLNRWQEGIVRQIGKGLGELAKRRNVRWIRGRARFSDSQHLTIACDDSPDLKLQFGHVIIASGARASFPPGLEPDGTSVLSSTEALQLTQVPRRLLVIGGGYIGLELGSCFKLLGSHVAIVELTPGLLPGTDPELVRPVLRRLELRGVRVLLQSRVLSLERATAMVRAVIQSGSDAPIAEEFDRVLVCVGRVPNTDQLDLRNAGVATDTRGFIECDDQGRTNQPAIFAIGDCSPGPLLAHKARRDGIVAAEVICGMPAHRNQKTIPAVIFCDPEIASCGLSEPESAAAGREIKVGRFPFAAVGRAVTHRAPDGMVKLIADRATEQVLGVGIVGPCASELIAEATLAVEHGMTVADLMHTIHAHPTLAEALPEAAELVRGASIHIYKRPR